MKKIIVIVACLFVSITNNVYAVGSNSSKKASHLKKEIRDNNAKKKSKEKTSTYKLKKAECSASKEKIAKKLPERTTHIDANTYVPINNNEIYCDVLKEFALGIIVTDATTGQNEFNDNENIAMNFDNELSKDFLMLFDDYILDQ